MTQIKYKASGLEVAFKTQIEKIGKIPIEFGLCPEEILNDLGMEIIDNTSGQILELVKEMFSRMDGSWVVSNAYLHNKSLPIFFASCFKLSISCFSVPYS